MAEPSTHGPDGGVDNGRDSNGRFTSGNAYGKGNPLAGRAARIRAVLLEKLTPETAAEIADKLIAGAKAGDLAMIRELLDRTIGRAVAADLLERIERLEELLDAQEREDRGINR
jgi:hypothetical protein